MKAEPNLSKLWEKVNEKYEFNWFGQWIAVAFNSNNEKPEILASAEI